MTRSDVSIIERSAQITHAWLDELSGELGVEDRGYAYRVLRAVLHTIRDRLTVDEAAQLAAQLPELIRGIFYEGWDPSSTPRRYRDAGEFLHRIEAESGPAGDTEASYAAAAVMRLLQHHVSAGELEDVLGVLPGRVRQVLAG